MRQLLTWRPRDDRARTIVKTLTYRMFMFVVTAAVALLVTGNLTDAVNIGIATTVIKTLAYYGYERTWARIHWGVTD